MTNDDYLRLAVKETRARRAGKFWRYEYEEDTYTLSDAEMIDLGRHLASRTPRKLRKNSRAKAAIVRVGWTVPGVAEGDTRTIREAERAIASERSRVGHLRARIVIHRADGAVERRSNV